MGIIEVKIPEGLPLKSLKKKIDDLVKKEETRWVLFERSIEEVNLSEAEPEELEEVRESIVSSGTNKIIIGGT